MWTAEEVSRLHTMRTGLKTVNEMAAELKKQPLDVENKLLSLGFKPLHKRPEPEQTSFNIGKAVEIPQPKRRKKRTQVTPEIEKRVCELRDERFKFSEIAEKTGISQATASRIAQRNGFPSEKRQVERTTKEPAPVAAETSSENIKTHNNITPNAATCKALLEEAKEALDDIQLDGIGEYNAYDVGQALTAIKTILKIMEE